jgi:hypothetical protein
MMWVKSCGFWASIVRLLMHLDVLVTGSDPLTRMEVLTDAILYTSLRPNHNMLFVYLDLYR